MENMMQETDLPIILNIVAAKNAGDFAVTSAMAEQLSPAVGSIMRAWLNSNTNNAAPLALKGWDAFFNSKWQLSANLFSDALSEPPWTSLTALGLGRLATRSGQWQQARNWLILASERARDEYNDLLLMKCHGALGELMLRTGNNHEALQHMQTAYTLCPSGHPHRQRQYSYMAMPLARMGKCQVAEEYYMNAYCLAMDQSEYLNGMHALARRAALILYNYNVDIASIGGEMQRLSESLLPTRLASIPYDYFRIVSFYQQWKDEGKRNVELLNNLFEGTLWEAWIVGQLNGVTSVRPHVDLPEAPTIGNPMQISAIVHNPQIPIIQEPNDLRCCLKTFFI